MFISAFCEVKMPRVLETPSGTGYGAIKGNDQAF